MGALLILWSLISGQGHEYDEIDCAVQAAVDASYDTEIERQEAFDRWMRGRWADVGDQCLP